MYIRTGRRFVPLLIQAISTCVCLLGLSACGESPNTSADSDASETSSASGGNLGSGGGSVTSGGTGSPEDVVSTETVLLVPAQAPEIFEDYVEPACPVDIFDRGASLELMQANGINDISDQSVALFSGTNLQEADVDEADRIKFDGEYLYIVDRIDRTSNVVFWPGGIQIIRPIITPVPLPRPILTPPSTPVIDLPTPIATPINAVTPTTTSDTALDTLPSTVPVRTVRVMAVNPDRAEASEVARISLPNANVGVHGLYHLPPGDENSGARLAVLGSAADEANAAIDAGVGGRLDSWFIDSSIWRRNRFSRTTLDIFDVDDPTEPIPVAHIVLDGRMLSSRQLDGRLILVTQFEAVRPQDSSCGFEGDPAPVVAEDGESAPLQLLPTITIDAGPPEPLVDIDDCFVPASALNAEYRSPLVTTVTSINLRNPDDRISMCLAGPYDSVYASSAALYLSQRESIVPVESPGELRTFRNGMRITKIALDPAGPIYRGSAFVDGYSSSTFSMGEHEGVLGVVTTVWPDHRLTLLREHSNEGNDPAAEPRLEIVSGLPNDEAPAPIGKPGESLHAVRFMGSRVYVVTFKKIDPLYIIDVSNPEHPFIAGELEIPGFSDYLHPIGENLLLGIGKDTFDMGDFAWYQGVKLELFDVSDPSTLSSVDSVLIGMRGSASAALSDHHAVSHLSLGERRHRFTIPIEVHEGPESAPSTLHPWVETGLYLFEVEENTNPLQSTIAAVGAIVREAAGQAANDDSFQDRWTTGDRAVLSGDQVHYIHSESVWSASWFAPEDAIGPQ